MALKYYEDNAVGADDVFTLPVPAATISAHFNEYEPQYYITASSNSFNMNIFIVMCIICHPTVLFILFYVCLFYLPT